MPVFKLIKWKSYIPRALKNDKAAGREFLKQRLLLLMEWQCNFFNIYANYIYIGTMQ